jgi:hypothetical protein
MSVNRLALGTAIAGVVAGGTMFAAGHHKPAGETRENVPLEFLGLGTGIAAVGVGISGHARGSAIAGTAGIGLGLFGFFTALTGAVALASP